MSSEQLFILSGPRTGSTLLRYILDTHSQIASPGELNLGPLCRQIEHVVRSTTGEALHALPVGERAARVVAETRAVVEGLMTSYLALKGKRIWCDKSITNLRELAALKAVFPQARFICLYRDSLDFVHSCLECSRLGYMEPLREHVVRQPDDLLSAMMAAWVEYTALSLDFERQNPERCHRVRYEDLVTAPEDCLRPLLEFVGVAWEDDLLESVFTRRHDHGAGDTKILFASRIDAARVGAGELLLALLKEPSRLAAEPLSAQLAYPPLAPGRQLRPAAAAAPAARHEAAAAEGAFDAAPLLARLGERAELAASLRGSCRLVLKGQGGGAWKLEFDGERAAVIADDGSADCTLIVSTADFNEMFAGRLNPAVALWERRVSVEGDPAMAAQVGQLLAR